MTPPLRIRRRSSSSRHGASRRITYPGGLGAILTTGLLACILAIGPLMLGGARLWIELPLLGLVAILLLVQAVRLTINPPSGASGLDAIDLAAVFFVLYAIVRWLTSPAEYVSRIEAMDILAYAGIFLICRYGMANRTYGMAILFLLVVLGVGETAFGSYLSNHSDWFPFGPTEQGQLTFAPRWLGTYEAPDHYACFLVMAIGTALALASVSKLPWPLRIVLYYLAVVMMIGVMYSGARGSWLALLASIGALLVLGIRNGTTRWWVPITGVSVLIAVAVFLFSQSPVVRERLDNAENLLFSHKLNTDMHVRMTVDALRIAHDHPLFGTGPATFLFVHPRYQDSPIADNTGWTHDDYLNCLDDYGLIGFGVALFFIAAVTLKFFSPLQIDNRWQDRVLVATGFAAWTALLVHSLVEFNLHIPANAFLLFALTGLGLGRLRQEKQKHWSMLPVAPWGRNLGWGIVALSLIFGVEVGRTAVSNRIFEAALARETELPFSESIESAEQALVYDPGNVEDLAFLGDLHRDRVGLQTEREARTSEGEKALDAYQKALRANALDDKIQARLGMTLDLLQRYPEALLRYESALAAQPHNGRFWYGLGDHYTLQGLRDKAAQAYSVAKSCPFGADRPDEVGKEPGVTNSGPDVGVQGNAADNR